MDLYAHPHKLHMKLPDEFAQKEELSENNEDSLSVATSQTNTLFPVSLSVSSLDESVLLQPR